MPKESFEQFVKRQKEKLERAEKIVEEVKEKWRKEFEKFEMVGEKSVEELKRLWEENEGEARKRVTLSEIFSFFLSLSLPEVPSFLLEKISNKFLKEFDWKKFWERQYIDTDLGFFLSVFLRKNIENYISSQKQKGIKEENIKPIEVHLKELPVSLEGLGYRNPQKLHLTVEGNLGGGSGIEMEGGEIIVKGNCGVDTGGGMKGGKIVVEGNCENFTGRGMKGGEIVVKGNCGSYTGSGMEGGVLILEGEVESFDKFAFSPDNKGTIIWKNTKIWENGNWTKEGREMWEKGEIPVKG